MQIYSQLEQLFKFRILSNAEIPAYLKRMMNAGKFDGPKQLAIMVMLLERVAALEERVYEDKSFGLSPRQKIEVNPEAKSNWFEGIEKLNTDSLDVKDTFTHSISPLSWPEVRAKARELGVFKPGLKRAELESLIKQKTM